MVSSDVIKHLLTAPSRCATLFAEELPLIMPIPWKPTGRIPSGNRKYQISHLWNLNKEIVRLSVAGLKNTEVAEELNITPQTVSITLNSRVAQDYMKELVDGRDTDVKNFSERIAALSSKALDRLAEIVEKKEEAGVVAPGLVASVSQDLLDRAGYGKVTKTANLNLNGTLSREELSDVYQHALNASRVAGESSAL